jgi:hypothetical protein
MNTELLKVVRNILLRTAAVSVVLSWLMAAATIGLWDTWSNLTSQWFRTPTSEMGPMMVSFFANIKLYIVFVLLAPALALHWTIKSSKA